MQRATLENNLPAWVRSWAPLPRFVPSACQNPGGAFPKTDMQTTMNITITNVKNANELDSFIPVEGEWFLDGSSEDRSREGVEQSVRNYMDADYAIEVQIFHADGRAIIGEIPASGKFLATRSH